MDPNFNKHLINEVQKYECLYNITSPEFRKVNWKRKIWEKISHKLRAKTIVCQKRWKTLRDTYTRMRRLEEKAIRENNPLPPRTFKFANALTFLDGHRHSIGESSDDDYDEDNNDQWDMSKNDQNEQDEQTEDVHCTTTTQIAISYIEDDDEVENYYDENYSSNVDESSSKGNLKREDTAALEKTNDNDVVATSDDPLVPVKNSTLIFFESLAHKLLSSGLSQQDVDAIEFKVATVVYKEIANCRNRKNN